MCVCVTVTVCVGFSSAELCCQAYRKWIIQIGFAKWIFIETVARHFVAVAICCCSCCLYFVPNDFCTFCPYIFSAGFYFFLFCVWVTIFRNLMWPVARFSVRPVARFVCDRVQLASGWLLHLSNISNYRIRQLWYIDMSIYHKPAAKYRMHPMHTIDINRNSNAVLVFIT